MNDKSAWLIRIGIGGAAGLAGYLLLSFLAQPGWLLGAPLKLDFTFCFNAQIPEALGALLGGTLWFAFGAQAGVATMPFDEQGLPLALKSLAHFFLMAATLCAWVLLNFPAVELPAFLIPFAILYALIWMVRWVGWYAEIVAMRKKLGLDGRKERNT